MRINQQRVVLILIITLSLFFSCHHSFAADDIQKAKQYIDHADTYYWLGVMEHGNMLAFSEMDKYLERAEEELRKTKEAGGISDSQKTFIENLEHVIEAHRTDLAEQAALSGDTFYGMAPVVRLLNNSIFMDALAGGTFELVDDPNVIAVCSAVLNLKEKLEGKLREPSIDTIVLSYPRDAALENEALYIFSSSPRFFTHNQKEIAEVLTPEEDKLLRMMASVKVGAPIIPESIKKKLMYHFNIEKLLVINIGKTDIVDNNYFYTLKSFYFNSSADAPIGFWHQIGFCRDRRAQVPFIIAMNLLLLALSFLIFRILVKDSDTSGKPAAYVAPLAAFVLGRVMPWTIFPMLHAFAPPPENLMKLSFWWPCIAGTALLGTPLIAYMIGSQRIGITIKQKAGGIAALFSISGKGGAIGIAAALGAVAYLQAPYFMLFQQDALNFLIPLTISAAAILYLTGRMIDTLDTSKAVSLIFLPAPVAASLLFGYAFCSASPFYLWSSAGISVAILIGVLRRTTKDDEGISRVEEPTSVVISESSIPADIEELAQTALFPQFMKTKRFQDLTAVLRPFCDNKENMHIALKGPCGVGKTATTEALIENLEETFSNKGGIEILRGSCPDIASNDRKNAPTAYAPFRDILSKYLNLEIIASQEDQLKQVSSLFGDIINTVVPWAGIIFPSPDGSSGDACSKDHLFNSIYLVFAKITRRKPVVMFIDDIQWIDNASMDLLQYLLERFPAGDTGGFLLITACRQQAEIKEAGISQSFELKDLNQLEQTNLLKTRLGLSEETAKEVILNMDSSDTDWGGLFWLLRVVRHLTQNGYFKKEENEFVFSDKYQETKKLPPPDEYRQALKEKFNSHVEYKSILTCAACLGKNFSATVLASSIGRDRLEVLELLDRIEKETGIIYDVKNNDDIFAFHSSFMLEVIFKNINMEDSGPKAENVPQVVREYHARVADSLEKELDKKNPDYQSIANHYYAAGASKAKKGYDYCIKAARASARIFDQVRALNYIKKADECASAFNGGKECKLELLLVKCDCAHVSGISALETADECISYVDSNECDDAGTLLTFARTCYDAAGQILEQNKKQFYFKKTIEIAKAVLAITEKTKAQEAEAYQFIAISLPLTDIKNRGEKLKTAYDLLKNLPGDDLESQAVLARVCDSRGGLLSESDHDAAMKYFMESLAIKERPEICDKKGIAITHGGLGRLAMDHTDPPDIETAKKHFEKDLEVSIEIGDFNGQSQMKSKLAECELKAKGEPLYENALRFYSESFELAKADGNKIFALCGILKCCAALKKIPEFDEAGEKLASIFTSSNQRNIHADYKPQIDGAVELAEGTTTAGWVNVLKNLER